MASWCYLTEFGPEVYRSLNRLERAAFVKVWIKNGPKPRLMVTGRR